MGKGGLETMSWAKERNLTTRISAKDETKMQFLT